MLFLHNNVMTYILFLQLFSSRMKVLKVDAFRPSIPQRSAKVLVRGRRTSCLEYNKNVK